MYLLPNAKINIGLNITSRREDGYHDIQTIFYPIPLTDSLELVKGRPEDEPLVLVLSGIRLDGNVTDNLVYRVFSDLQKEFELPHTIIYLSKHIPSGAGLGGGSSDAAYTMLLANDFYKLNLTDSEMEQRLSAYGADCPFFIRNKAVYAQGIGNQFTPLDLCLKGYYILIVKPSVSVSTAEAYANVVPKNPQVSLYDNILNTPINLWRNIIKNDFESHVFSMYPSMAAIKETLYDMGAIYASMSGSGSAIYGIFNRPIDNAAKVFADCFTFAGALR